MRIRKTRKTKHAKSGDDRQCHGVMCLRVTRIFRRQKVMLSSGARQLLLAHPKNPQRKIFFPQEMLQETRTFPKNASMLGVDKQQKLDRRMASRHRDRENHRRSLVVWESVLKPHWMCSVLVALWSLRAWWDGGDTRCHPLTTCLLLCVAQTVGGTSMK